MSYLLALDCSMTQGSLALLKDNKKNQFQLILESQWEQEGSSSYHSDRLPKELERITAQCGILLKDIKSLAAGLGPGRWTGLRTALLTAKSLAYSLNLPVYPINSLKALAENSKIRPVFTAIYAFENQVYFGQFDSNQSEIGLLDFSQWRKKMESLKADQINCISDLKDFYPAKDFLNLKINFIKPRVSAFKLAQILLREKIPAQKWFELKAFYLKSPVKALQLKSKV